MITIIKDREDNLRRLLNLAGIRPIAYYIGLFFGDLILINIPALIAIVLAAVLQIEVFANDLGGFTAALFFFSVGFLPFNYLISFIFSKVETGFKY